MFKVLVIVLFTLYFLFQMFLNILKYKNRNSEVPSELADLYDQETYIKWKNYSAEKIKLQIIEECINYVLTIVILVTNILAFASKNIENDYSSSIVVLLISLASAQVLSSIFDYINTMKIEEKYGFNKTTKKTFIIDQIKNFIIMSAILIGITCLFISLHKALGNYILIVFTAVLFVIILGFVFLYPILSKINNKFVSLEEGSLRDSLIKMLESHNFKVKDIKVMDASRRTTKSNAYFAGFGKTKTIVLYDNILNVMTEREILAIFAHEMGHGIHKDTIKNQALTIVQLAIIVFLAWVLTKVPTLYTDFGFNNMNYGFLMIVLSNALLPFANVLMNMVSSLFSRKAEYKADEQACIEGYGQDLISALKNLYREDLGELNPHPLIVILSYTHPTLLQRIRHINEFNSNK